jgi:hypothetical protein
MGRVLIVLNRFYASFASIDPMVPVIVFQVLIRWKAKGFYVDSAGFIDA